MKKLISKVFVFVTAMTLTAGSSSVFAQETSATASSTTANSSAESSAANAKYFQERKDKILKHISDRLTKIQQIQSCVQAANDLAALHACKPHRGKKHADTGHGGPVFRHRVPATGRERRPGDLSGRGDGQRADAGAHSHQRAAHSHLSTRTDSTGSSVPTWNAMRTA